MPVIRKVISTNRLIKIIAAIWFLNGGNSDDFAANYSIIWKQIEDIEEKGGIEEKS